MTPDVRVTERVALLRPDGRPVTDADFPASDDAFRVTLTLSRFPVPEEGGR